MVKVSRGGEWFLVESDPDVALCRDFLAQGASRSRGKKVVAGSGAGSAGGVAVWGLAIGQHCWLPSEKGAGRPNLPNSPMGWGRNRL